MGQTKIDLVDVIEALTPRQKQIIEQEILTLLSEDNEVQGEVTDLKHIAYKTYAKDIACLIAKVEVYAHDLPDWIYGLIEMIFRLCSVAIVQSDDEAKVIYETIIGYEGFLINYVHLFLIDYFTKEIKQYKKTLKRFNHRSVKTKSGYPVIAEIDARLKEMVRLKKVGRKVFKECYRFDKKTALLKFKTDNKPEQVITELARCVKEAEIGLDICEKYYPDIIDNGFVDTPLARAVNFLPEVIAFAFALAGVIITLIK